MAEQNPKFADLKSRPERNAFDTIWASAVEAFGSAIFLWILGDVAIGLAAGFAGDMVPSPPPGFGSEGKSGHAKHHHGSWQGVPDGAFWFFFATFFIHSLWVGFRGAEAAPGQRVRRILSNLRQHWFRIIVGNAISAWVAALLLDIIPNFSLWRIVWGWVWDSMVAPVVHEIGRFLFGSSNAEGLGNWVSWYDSNQAKLYFWIIYLGGVMDDLGMPNFKTLARWGWRRFQRRQGVALAPSVDTEVL